MKKSLFLFLLILTCCSPAHLHQNPEIAYPTRVYAPEKQITGSPAPTTAWSDYRPSVEAFDTSEKCPRMCWLGINPGVTMSEEARILLKASNKIDQKQFHIGEDGITTLWYYESTKELSAYVHITYNQDVVGSIKIDNMQFFKVSDFVNLLGEPDQMSIYIQYEVDAIFIPYNIYYSSHRILMGSEVYEKIGPTSNNIVSSLSLNVELYSKDFQPWLGFGHLQEYLPGQKLPEFPLARPYPP